MYGIDNFGAFLITALVLNLTPGADTMYILSRSIAQGRRAGIYSALGIGAGIVFHTLMAAVGLSAILVHSAILFNLVKYCGAAYLVYLGIRAVMTESSELLLNKSTRTTSTIRLFWAGALTNILNPKVALFFMALLPQFIVPQESRTLLPCLLLGGTFVVTGTSWNLILACLSAAVYERSARHPNIIQKLNQLAGIVYVALGIKVAFAARR